MPKGKEEKTEESSELRRLREENSRLRLENAYLKKLKALADAEERRQGSGPKR
jgi:transposase-like protein